MMRPLRYRKALDAQTQTELNQLHKGLNGYLIPEVAVAEELDDYCRRSAR